VTSEAHDLLQHALALPPGERAGVAAVLLASLDGEPEDDAQSVDEAWTVELERRARRVTAGESAATPWPDVRDDLAARLAER
jgi:putative addiction module component (TIGR02574 family)